LAPEDARLVVYTWKRIGPLADRAAGLFYDRLFEITPTTRAHVSVDMMPAFRRSLMTSIDWAVNEILRSSTIASVRPGLAAAPPLAHDARDPFLGAAAEQASAALLWMLHAILGRDWTPRHEAAWTAAAPEIVAALRPAPSIV